MRKIVQTGDKFIAPTKCGVYRQKHCNLKKCNIYSKIAMFVVLLQYIFILF